MRTCLFECSTLSLLIVNVDCVIGYKVVYLVTPIRQPISMATRWQHSSSYWTIGNIVNCWHQHRTVHSTVMLQYEENCLIVARLGLLDKCGRRNAVWFLMLIRALSTSVSIEILRGFLHLNVSPYLSKDIDRLFQYRFYYRKQCRNIGRFFLTIVLFPLLISAKTHCR